MSADISHQEKGKRPTQPSGQRLFTMEENDLLVDPFAFARNLTLLPVASSKLDLADRPTAKIRSHFSDFEVSEQLAFEPSGEGEHLFLLIEKNRCNSEWVANQLQQQFALRSQDVGYAGKKDRHSLSRQWFSLHLPGREVSLDNLDNEFFRVVSASRHNKKLRKGAIAFNHFKIKMNEVSGKVAPSALERIKNQGFPNYFGYQRFGWNGQNLQNAMRWFNQETRVRSRNKRSIYLSAARSYLFNLLLAQRINQDNWCQGISGDCLNLTGSRSYFCATEIDSQTSERLLTGDLHPSGWMAGRQASESTLAAALIEENLFSQFPTWLAALARLKVDSARRPLRVIPTDVCLALDSEQTQTLSFKLPSGSYATALLAELFDFSDESLNSTHQTGGSDE